MTESWTITVDELCFYTQTAKYQSEKQNKDSVSYKFCLEAAQLVPSNIAWHDCFFLNQMSRI